MPTHTARSAAQVGIALAVALGALACGSAQVAEESPLPADVKPQGLVVLPVALIVPEADALEIAAASLAVTRQLLARTDLPIIGPLDFDLNKTLDEARNASYDTDLVARDGELGADWRSWLALHVLVTENRATNVRDIVDVKAQAAGKPGTFRQHGIEATVRVEVGLYDVRRGTRLAFTASETPDDPTQFTPGADPRPGVSKAIAAGIDRLIAMVGPAIIGPAGRRARGDGLADSLPAMLSWRAPERPAWLDKSKDLASEVREAKIYSLWDRFVPGLDVKEIFAANKAKGLIVRAKAPPLEAGDVVTAVDGKKAQAAYQFDRLLRACSPTPTGCRVDLLRGGAATTVMLRWPALPAPVVAE